MEYVKRRKKEKELRKIRDEMRWNDDTQSTSYFF